MELFRKYSRLRMMDGLMIFLAMLMTVTAIVFVCHKDWLNALMNGLWAFIAWRNYQMNVRMTTAGEVIEIQDRIIDSIRKAVKAFEKEKESESCHQN